VQHGKRADAIVKSMLLYSREGSGEYRLVDANALVEESVNLAHHGARAENQSFKINMEACFDPTVRKVDPAGDHAGSLELDFERLLCGYQAQRAGQ
jgi:two-component system NtrC family sensor kinase